MADTKLSALTELAAAPASTDEVYIRDVSEAAADESKRLTVANLFTSPALTTPALGTPASGVMTNVTGLPTAGLLDDAVTLAKMAAGTDGNLITYDANGDPAAVATGTSGQVLTSNGAGAAPTFQAASGGGGAVTREGGNTTEATTTSVTAVNLLSVASLNIAAAAPFMGVNVYRKSAGAAVAAGGGLTLNATVIAEAAAAASFARSVTGGTSAIDEAEHGLARWWVTPIVTGYTFGNAQGQYEAWISTGAGAITPVTTYSGTGVKPNAAITDVVTRAITGDAAVTYGQDELHIYSYATS